jgi:glycerol kinase
MPPGCGRLLGYLDDLRINWQVEQTWKPAMVADVRDALYRGWLKAVERTFDWVE